MKQPSLVNIGIHVRREWVRNFKECQTFQPPLGHEPGRPALYLYNIIYWDINTRCLMSSGSSKPAKGGHNICIYM